MANFQHGPDITQEIVAALERNNQKAAEPTEQPAEPSTDDNTAEAATTNGSMEQQPAETTPTKTENAPWKESFQALREKASRIERERDEALRKLQQYETQIQPKQSITPEPVDEDIKINDDELVEGKQVKKLVNKLRNLEASIKANQEQSAMLAMETRLKAQYPDFDSVVNEANFNALDPEVRTTIQSSQDTYAKAVSAYKLIKKFGIGQPDPYQNEKNKIAANAQKPRTATSITPKEGGALGELSQYGDELTPELQDKLYKDMIRKSKTFF